VEDLNLPLTKDTRPEEGPGTVDAREKRRERIYNFLQVPLQLEKLLLFGFCMCLDSFLFLFTFLPFRVIIAFFTILLSVVSRRNRVLPAHLFDVCRGGIFLICCIALQFVDISQAYHSIRGQAAIKLYVIFNVLECFDKLFCSFGQDVLASLFWSAERVALALATSPLASPAVGTDTPATTTADGSPGPGPGGVRMEDGHQEKGIHGAPSLSLLGAVLRGLLDFVIGLIYMFCHTLVLFYQVVTLNVAVNSHNNALLTVLVSNNFVELKGSVFKRFEDTNLFQITCSDMVERFQLFVFIAIVIVQNASNTDGLSPLNAFWIDPMAGVAAMVWFSEMLIDWFKHAFATKFNDMRPELYSRFQNILCTDIVKSRRTKSAVDHSHALSKRIGFVPLPLGCVAVRIFCQTMPSLSPLGCVLTTVMYACIWAGKVLVSICIVGYAAKRLITAEGGKQEENDKLLQVDRYSISSRGVAG